MRFKLLILTLSAALLTGLVIFVIGCGSDDSNVVDSPDFNDPEFVAIQGEVERVVDSMKAIMTSGIGNLQGLATDTVVNPILYTPLPIDSVKDSAHATYANGWHEVYISLNHDDFVMVLRDSIQFLQDGTPQQNTSGLDQLKFKHNWAFNVTDTTVTHNAINGNTDLDFLGLDTTEAAINGTHSLEVYSKVVTNDSTVWREFAIDATMTDLTINLTPVGWASTCPASGAVTADVQMTYQKDAGTPVVTDWTVTIVFNDGFGSISVVSGNTTWEYTSSFCTPPVSN
jgi:hypothetical protein